VPRCPPVVLRSPAPSFVDAVTAVIRAIPAGEVSTYGEVAAEAGFPGAARAVGNLLLRSDDPLPWWRVVASTGRLVPGHEVEHARHLRAEGVRLDPVTARVRAPERARGGPGTRPRATGTNRVRPGERRPTPPGLTPPGAPR